MCNNEKDIGMLDQFCRNIIMALTMAAGENISKY